MAINNFTRITINSVPFSAQSAQECTNEEPYYDYVMDNTIPQVVTTISHNSHSQIEISPNTAYGLGAEQILYLQFYRKAEVVYSLCFKLTTSMQ